MERAAEIEDEVVTLLVGSGAAEKVHLVGPPAGACVTYARKVDGREGTARRVHCENLPAAVPQLADKQIRHCPDRRASNKTVDGMANAASRCGGPNGCPERAVHINRIARRGSGRLIQLQVETALHIDTQTHTNHK